jgi:hypothetical protein
MITALITPLLRDKRARHLSIMVLVLWISSTACDLVRQPDSNQAIASIKLPVIKDGILVFETMGDLTNLLSEFDNGLTLDDFQNLVEKDGYRSMYKYANSVLHDPIHLYKVNITRNAEYDEDPAEMVEDYYFASILNEDGLVWIEGSMFRVTHEYVFWVGGSDPTILLNDAYLASLVDDVILQKSSQSHISLECDLQSDPYLDPITEVHFAPVMRLEDSMVCSGGAGGYGGSDPSNSELKRVEKRDYTSNPSRRVVAESWNTSWFIYASIGALTKNQKKTLGLYFKAPADLVSVSTSFSYFKKLCPGACGYETETLIEGSLGDSKQNGSIAKVKIDWKTGIYSTNLIKFKGAGAFKVVYIRSEHVIENPHRINLFTEWK